MPLDEYYEILGRAQCDWQLLGSARDSQQAIEQATKFRRNQKYCQIRVTVRPLNQAASGAAPRLLYQFTRSGVRPLDQDSVLETLGDPVDVPDTAPRPPGKWMSLSRLFASLKYWTIMMTATAFIALVFTD